MGAGRLRGAAASCEIDHHGATIAGMKRFVPVLLILSGFYAQAQTQNVTVSAGVPSPVSVGTSYVGAPGQSSIYYYVCSNFTPGQVCGFQPSVAGHTIGIAGLSASNRVTITWSVNGAASYNVFRFSEPGRFSGSCNFCMIAQGVAGNSYVDQSPAAGTHFAYTPIQAASGTILLDNVDYNTPGLLWNLGGQPYPFGLVPPNATLGDCVTFTAQPGFLGDTPCSGLGGINQLHGDVTAGPGTGNQLATVVGLESVPFCTGYSPTNGQAVELTTGGSPNPCYTAATPAGGSINFHGTPTATAIVTDFDTTHIQTPSATSTMDSSGNISTPGSVSTSELILPGASAGQVDFASSAGGDGYTTTATGTGYVYGWYAEGNGEIAVTDGLGPGSGGNYGHVDAQTFSWHTPHFGSGANAIPACEASPVFRVGDVKTVSDPVTAMIGAVYVAGGTNNSNFMVVCQDNNGTFQWVLLDGSNVPGVGTITAVVAGTGLSGGGSSGSVTVGCMVSTASQIGCAEPDNSTITASGGVYSAAATTVNGATCTGGGTCNGNYTSGAITTGHLATFTGTGNQIHDGGAVPTGSNYNGYGMWNLTVPAPGAFTQVNYTGASTVSGTHFMSILAPSSGSNNLRILNQACPSAPWDLYSLVLVSGAQNGSPYEGGIEFDDGTKILSFGILSGGNGGGNGIYSINFTNVTTFASTVNSMGNYPAFFTPVWFHANNTLGVLQLQYSFDGVAWSTLTTAATGFLSAVTNCGVYANPVNTAVSSTTVLAFQFGSLTAQ